MLSEIKDMLHFYHINTQMNINNTNEIKISMLGGNDDESSDSDGEFINGNLYPDTLIE